MTGIRLLAVVCGVLGSGLFAFAEKRPYSRYAPIVERQPFGAIPDSFDPSVNPSTVSVRETREEKQLTVEQEQLKRSVKFSVINVDPEGIVRVGFSDLSSGKQPRHYYLAVGESRDGWTVAAADAAARTAQLSKDGVELDLSLGGESTEAQKAMTGSPAYLAGARTPDGASSARSASGGGLMGAKARSRQRRLLQAEERAQIEAEQKKRAEEEKVREEERKIELENMRADLADLRKQMRQDKAAKDGGRQATGADAADETVSADEREDGARGE